MEGKPARYRVLSKKYEQGMRWMNKSQKGQTLIEVLIALAILAIVVVAYLTALTTSSRAIIIADERTTTESLTRSELEYVKSQDFSDTTDPGPWSYQASETACQSPWPGQPPNKPSWWDDTVPDFHTLPDEYAGYSVIVFATGCGADGDSENDEGIWEVTVEVYHSDTPSTPSSDDWVLTAVNYKVER